jgi:hypothetical protein
MVSVVGLARTGIPARRLFTRMVNDPRTRHYIERRMKDGQTKKEAIRCLKRYVAREV